MPSTSITKYSWIAVIFMFIGKAYGQSLEINCGQIKQLIPKFEQTDWYTLNNQFPVKANLIGPINKSSAKAEIRVYRYYTSGTNQLDVIRCDSGQVNAVRYAYMDATTHDGYSNGSPLKFRMISSIRHLKLRQVKSWSMFFEQLVNNNLFALPDINSLNTEVLRRHPAARISPIGDGYRLVIEIEVAKNFRVIQLTNGYMPEPLDIKNYVFSKAIVQTLNDLTTE